MRISWNTVGPIIERVEKDLDINPNARFDNLVRIGVDETSYRKGHKYITTVVNHDTGNVIWVAKGHGKTIFEQFFKLLTPGQRNSIQLVSGDGAKWIDECIKEYCPNANRCVDPFHVIEWAMDALDSVRVDAWRKAKAATKEQPKARRGRPKKDTPSKDITATELKNSKIALGKAPSNLTPNQQDKAKIRMAYGFRNIDNMMTMIMLRCSDIKVQLPWEKDEWSSFFCLGQDIRYINQPQGCMHHSVETLAP